MEAVDTDHHGYRPASLSWTIMFKQLKEYHGKGKKNKRPIPARIIRWMSMQQRQYRVYGIGLKEPVGIIKHRVKKLNELGFEWNPSLMNIGQQGEQEEDLKQKPTTSRSSTRRSYSNTTPEQDNESDTHKSSFSSRRRSSYTSELDELDTPTQTPAPPTKRKDRDDSTPNKVKGITRQGPNKKWQVRTNDKKTNRRIYLGSFWNHADAVAALEEWQEKQHTPARKSKVISTVPKKKLVIAQEPSLKSKPVRTKGISRHGKRFEVRIYIKGKKGQKYIGSYDTEAEAIEALNKANCKFNPDGMAARAGTGAASKQRYPDAVDYTSDLCVHSERTKGNDNMNIEDDTVSLKDEDSNDRKYGHHNGHSGTKFTNEALETPIRSNISSTKNSTVQKKRSLFTSKTSPEKIRGLTQKKGGKWEVQCYNNGVRRYIGRVDTREEGIRILQEEGHDDLVQVDEKAPNGNGLKSYDNQSEENDDSTIETEDGEKDDATNNSLNDDDTTKSGNDTEGDTTDGEVEPESPRAKYFPLILYKMVNDSSQSTPEILEWLPCGSAFRINDYEHIGEVLLGKYFRSSQYSSFHRMLNLYGFAKMSVGKYQGAFKHPQFHRDISTEDTILARVVKKI